VQWIEQTRSIAMRAASNGHVSAKKNFRLVISDC
jgi:hypothetical protein